MNKMRYSDAPDWAYGGKQHPVRIQLTLAQVKSAVKRVPTFKMKRIGEYMKDLMRPSSGWEKGADKWEYIRKTDGSTWLVGYTWFMARCFEIPPTIAKRFEKLNDLVESW
jgi:hypothetical protein